MKKLSIVVFLILSVTLISCSDRTKSDLNRRDGGAVKKVDSNLLAGKNENRSGRQQIINKEIGTQIPGDAFNEKIENGEIILLTKNGEPEPFEFIGSKIMAMQMPDRKLHQVEVKGDKIILHVPGKGKMEAIRLNGKIYLFDDDNKAYEVKVINNELAAEATDLTDMLLSMK